VVFLKRVPDPHRFGVAELAAGPGTRVIAIEEKPKHPRSDYAVTGLYIYDPAVFRIIETLKPSGRGELEITDVNNEYIRRGSLRGTILPDAIDWTDAGTFESLYRANQVVAGWSRNAGKKA
jgi:glucose-1-phosphate thymidylyltransferase